jgi:Fur family ferric uptake transcriptional regulator
MKIKQEEQFLENCLASKNLKYSKQRKIILKIFLKAGKHVSPDELYRIVQKKYPRIGYATIYRTMRLFCECGLSRELKFHDGITRYEPQHGYTHHDHLICSRCGRLVEVIDPEIERLQEKLVQKHGFHFETHRMELYGICPRCKK